MEQTLTIQSLMSDLFDFCKDTEPILPSPAKEEKCEKISALLQRLVASFSQRETFKDWFCFSDGFVHDLLYILTVYVKHDIRAPIVQILQKLCAGPNSGKRALLLVQTGATRAVLQALRAESQELVSNEELMIKIHKVLCKLALCDRKFAFRARLSQCLPVTLAILRNQIALLQAFVAHAPSTSKTRGVSIARAGGGNASTAASVSRTPKKQSGSGPKVTYLPQLPTSLTSNIRILLETIHFYTRRPCRSNAVSLCKSGLISLLVKAVSLAAGLPHIRQVINTDALQPTSTESEVVKPTSSTATAVAATNNAAAAATSSTLVPPDLIGQSPSQQQSAAVAAGEMAYSPVSPTLPPPPTLQQLDNAERLRLLASLSLEQATSKACDIMVSSSAAIKAIANVVSATVATHRQQMTPLGGSSSQQQQQQTSSGSQEAAKTSLSLPPVPVATGVKHNAQIIQLFLSTLLSLMKWKRNIARASMSGAVPVLLDLFLDVHRCDLRCRRIQLQLLSLSCLQYLTAFRSGRKAILAAGGLFALFAVCSGFVGPNPNAAPAPPPPPRRAPPSLPQSALPKPPTSSRRAGKVQQQASPPQKPSSTRRPSQAAAQPHTPGRSSSREESHTLSTSSHDVSAMTPRQAYFTEAVLIKACILLRSCCPRIRLPIAQAESVLHLNFFEDKEDQTTKKPPRPSSEQSEGSASTPGAGEGSTEQRAGLSLDGTKPLRRKNTPKEVVATEPARPNPGKGARTAKPPRGSTRASNTTSRGSTKTLRRKPITDFKSIPPTVVGSSSSLATEGGRAQVERKGSGGLPSVQRKMTPSGSEISEGSKRSGTSPRRIRSQTTNKGEGGPSKLTRRGSLPKTPSISTVDVVKPFGGVGGETNVSAYAGSRRAAKSKTSPVVRTKPPGGRRRRPRARCASDESNDDEEEEDDLDDDDDLDDVDDDEEEEEAADKRKEGEREDTALGGAPVVRRKQSLRPAHRAGAATARGGRRRRRHRPMSDNAFWMEDDSAGGAVGGGSDVGFALSSSSSSSNSSCATPYLSDMALDTVPKLTLGELLSTHQQFFPEWRDLPSTGTMEAFNLRFDDALVASTEAFFERLITDTEAAQTDPEKYLIHARELQSAIDYSVPQVEKLVAYPDLICATGPPYKEPFFKHHLKVFENPIETAPQPVSPSMPAKRSPRTANSVSASTPTSAPISIPNSVNPLFLNPPGSVPFSLMGLKHAEILDDVRRLLDSDDIIDRVVYDLDDLILQALSAANADKGRLVPPSRDFSSGDYVTFMNSDELIAGNFDSEKDSLEFESRFECGNLRKAIQVRQHEYDLILSPDVNTYSHTQWFYFRVSNIESNVRYRFNITNLEKPGSQYNAGMQPLVFSVCEAMEGRPYWLRSGENVKYYKNHFLRMASPAGLVGSRNYYTATFTIEFKHCGDVCYLAYHYPYSHSRLLTDITRWQIRAREAEKKRQLQPGKKVDCGLYLKVQRLTNTLLANPLPLITVTERGPWSDSRATSFAAPVTTTTTTAAANNTAATTTTNASRTASTGEGKRQKPYIFLTGRVHPGETNASWVMRGLLERLTDPDDAEMQELRRMFIFKIVPLLNPDGVICGNHRCSLAARDLNRQWINPSSTLHPTIYHTKCLINLLAEAGNTPFIYIDCHGHSRQKDVFLYGCDPRASWKSSDYKRPKSASPTELMDEAFLELADVLDKIALPFSQRACGYSICRIKESTGRVVLWRQFKVARSYTLEASYCGVTRDCWLDQAGDLSGGGGGVGDTGVNRPAPTVSACAELSSTLMGISRDEIVSAAASTETGHQIAPTHLESMGADLCRAFLLLQTLEPRTPRAESQAPTTRWGRGRSSSARPAKADEQLSSEDEEEMVDDDYDDDDDAEEEVLADYNFEVGSDVDDDDDDDDEELVHSSEETMSVGGRSLDFVGPGVPL